MALLKIQNTNLVQENAMTNCNMCGEPIKGTEPYIEIESNGHLYHTCKGVPTCYQLWLEESQEERRERSRVNALCDLSPGNIR